MIDKLSLVGKKRGGNEGVVRDVKNRVTCLVTKNQRIAKIWARARFILEFPLVPILALVANTEASEKTA